MSPYLNLWNWVFGITPSTAAQLIELFRSNYKKFTTITKQYKTLISLLCFSLLLTACAMGPDYSRPQIDTGEKFRLSQTEGRSIANFSWWELLQDQKL